MGGGQTEVLEIPDLSPVPTDGGSRQVQPQLSGCFRHYRIASLRKILIKSHKSCGLQQLFLYIKRYPRQKADSDWVLTSCFIYFPVLLWHLNVLVQFFLTRIFYTYVFMSVLISCPLVRLLGLLWIFRLTHLDMVISTQACREMDGRGCWKNVTFMPKTCDFSFPSSSFEKENGFSLL